MDARKILVGAAVAAGIALSGAGSGVGAEGVARLGGGDILDCEPIEEIYDDFADGNPFDGIPVQWRSSSCCPGQFPPAEGSGVEVRPLGDLSTGLGYGTLTGDISVRIRGSLNGTLPVPNAYGVLPHLSATVHWSESGDSLSGYSGDVHVDGGINIYKFPDFRELVVGQLDFDPRDGDLYIELSRRGNELELRVWRPDLTEPDDDTRPRERPEIPLLTYTDGSFHAGYAGFYGWFGAGNPIIVRSLWIAREDCPAPSFIRGDSNGDGQVDISDAVTILNWLFLLDTPELGCKAAANVNGDEADNVEDIVDIFDPVYLLNFLFLGTPAPPPPYPNCAPGDLPADKALGCETAPASCQ